MNCLICKEQAFYGDLCKECWLGLKCFARNTKLLARAIQYLGNGKFKLKTKHQRREGRKRRTQLDRLIESQRRDAQDRNMRFDNALSK